MSQQPSLIIHAQYTKDLSFENPRSPILLQIESEPHFNIGIDINTLKLNDNLFEVMLKINVKASYNDEPLFICELAYGGVFTINEVNEDEIQKILLIQCPLILFPFARRIVSDVSRDGGYPPVSLDPVDFYGLYLQKKDQIEALDNVTSH